MYTYYIVQFVNLVFMHSAIVGQSKDFHTHPKKTVNMIIFFLIKKWDLFLCMCA